MGGFRFRIWTKEEEDILINLHRKFTKESLAIILGRTTKAIIGRAHVLKLKLLRKDGNRAWTKEEDDILINLHKKFTTKSLSIILSRSIGAIHGRAFILRLKLVHPCKYKKGDQPPNAKKDGDISIWNHGGRDFKLIRLGGQQWKFYHRYVWEQANGPIPKGMLVTFKNGDNLDCSVENLKLMSRKEFFESVSIHNYPEELKETIRLLGFLKKQIRKEHGREKQQD